MIGLGTLVNVAAILIGASIGVLFGSRLPAKTSQTVTSALGLLVLVLGAQDLASLGDKALVAKVSGPGAFMVVMFAVLIGTVAGSLAGIEARLEQLGGWLQSRFRRDSNTEGNSRERFITGFVDASLIFAIGPMAILGAMADALGQGANTLYIKSTLDAFTSIAFAAGLGWGVAASALTVGVWQGLITVVALFAGSFIPAAQIASITATGGVLMLAIGVRLIGVKQIAVADMLPALIIAPILTTFL